jgi:hypothetical protein
VPNHPTLPKVSLYEPRLGRLELGGVPYVVEGWQIGSPAIRDNSKDRALADGVFDDTLYHGASAITLTTRLASRTNCGGVAMGTLRNALAAYCHPRLRPQLQWRYPYDDVAQWATVRGVSWPFQVNGPKYPMFVVQFTNPLGQFFLGDLADPINSATSYPGEEAGGRTYDLSYPRNYPNVATPGGTVQVTNIGNAWADWKLEVHGPFDVGATVVLGGHTIEFNQAVVAGQYVTLRSLNSTIEHVNGLSYYPYTNFGDWSWEDLKLPTGSTPMTYYGETTGTPSGWATIEWYHTGI